MNCPLCGNSKHMPKGKLLYGKHVCKKCLYKFANRRQFAYLIDYLVITTASSFVRTPVLEAVAAATGWSPASQLEVAGVSFFVFGIPVGLVFALKDGFVGKSLGKLICRIQVRNVSDYEPIGFRASFKRNLCLLIPFVPIFILVQMAKGQRLGDRWAGTRVIWDKFADNPVFTGAELPPDAEVFDEQGARQEYAESDNPFQAPLE